MPTYEYACRECGHRFETVQSFADDPLRVCPSCGGDLRKVFSAAGIIFKGSGYYVTDSRSAAAGNGAGKRDKAGSSEAASSGGESSGATSASDTASGTGAPRNRKEAREAAAPAGS